MAKLDYSIWDDYKEFTSNQAAYLWYDLEPNQDISLRPPHVLAMINRLDDAIERGVLPCSDTSRFIDIPGTWDAFAGSRQRYHEGEKYVSIKALSTWAEVNDMKPKFLFKEEREIDDKWRHEALIASGKAFNTQPNDNTNCEYTWNVERIKDGWVEVIEKVSIRLYKELGVMPTVTQAWSSLFSNPPDGYGIKACENSLTLTMPGEIRIGNPEFK